MLQDFLDAAPDAMLIADAQSGRIVQANTAAEGLFGYQPGELVGTQIEALIPQRFRAAHPGHRERYAREPRARPMGVGLELFACRKDGSEFPAEISLSPLQKPGGLRVIAAIRDTTERRKAEEERFRLAQAQETAQERERVMAILGHDLRSPLTAIKVTAESQLRRGRLDTTDIRCAERILASGIRMERIINHLMDFARARAEGVGALALEPFSLSALCHDLVDELSHAYPACAIQLDTIGNTRGEWDRERVSAAIANLLRNAILHGDCDRPISTHLHGNHNEVVIEVHNHGNPIPPELVPCLFDPFRRGKSEEHGERRGLGLGLYIARQAVKAHGGQLDVSSSADTGTCFTVRLPKTVSSRAGFTAPDPTTPRAEQR